MALDDQQLFQRFCRGGDVGALGELFDRTAPALLRLALHLSRDPAAAEDLVQSTFLRAIEVRDEWDDDRPILPWLCGILQNRARHDRWQGGRAPDPTRLPSTPAVDPARAAERAEFDAAVDAAIAGLPEVYRPVLRLHLAYGHQPTEIAHALERPPGTVRSQLARGLDLLRKALPAGFAGGAALLLASGRGLAAVKQVVLGHAAIALPAVVAGSVIGGVVLMKKLVVVAAVAILAAGGWLMWPRPEAGPMPRAAGGSEPLPVTADASRPQPADRAEGKVANDRIAAATSPPVTTGALRIHCSFAEDASPAWGITVSVTPATRDGEIQQRSVVTADDGSALVAELPAGEAFLAPDRGGWLKAAVSAGATRDVELVIQKGLFVRGRVVDDQGGPVAGAMVWLSSGAHDCCDGAFVATTDPAGRFTLRAVEPERFLSATAAGHRSSLVQPVRGPAGSAVEIELVLPATGASLVGRVQAQDGTPAAGARVFVGWRESWRPATYEEYRPPLELRTAADGTFAAHGLAPGSQQPVWIRAIGTCLWYRKVELAREGDTVLTVQLQTGAVLSGRVTGAAGNPIDGAEVDYRSTAWFPANGDFQFDLRGPGWTHYAAATDADGRYRIDCITPGTLRLLARKDQLEVRGELVVSSGGSATWDPVLVEIAIHGRVVDERGAPLADVEVQATPPRGKGNFASDKTDRDGRFACRALAPVPYVLKFYAAGDAVRARPAASLFGIAPAGEELLVRLPDAALPSATLTGRLLDTDGRPPQLAAHVSCASPDLHWEPSAEVDPATGEFHIGPLPPGTWRLSGSVGQGEQWRRSGWCDPFVLAAREQRDCGVLQMPVTGAIQLTVTTPAGLSLDSTTVALEASTGWSETPYFAARLADGKALVERVAPGNYRLRVGGGALPTVFEPVTVTAGATATATIAVPKGVGVELVLSPVSEPVPMHETFVWRRDGELLQRYANRWEGNGERVWKQRLLSGSYEVTITSETGKQTTNRFVVDASDADGRRIAIALP